MALTKTYVEGIREFSTSVGNLVVNVQELRGRLTSISNDAYKRIVTAGKQDVGKTKGTRVSMIVNSLRGEKPVLLKQERFPIRLARELVEANSKGEYFSTNSARAYETASRRAEQEDRKGIKPAQRTAIICPSQDNFLMSPDENKQYYEFVFEDMAYENEENGRVSYFQLNKGPITFFPIDKGIVDSVKGTIQNYMWFKSLGLGCGSGLVGDYRGAHLCYDRARGMLNRSAEGASQKISATQLKTELPYTQI